MWWEVVPKTVPGRLASNWPVDWQRVGALIDMDWVVATWPVVTKFVRGTRLRALPDSGGGIFVKDIDGGSWLRVALPSGGLCFVRAHQASLKPVNGPVL